MRRVVVVVDARVHFRLGARRRAELGAREVLEGRVLLVSLAQQRHRSDVIVELPLDEAEDCAAELHVLGVGRVVAVGGVRDDPEGEHNVLGGVARVDDGAYEGQRAHLGGEAGRLGVHEQERQEEKQTGEPEHDGPEDGTGDGLQVCATTAATGAPRGGAGGRPAVGRRRHDVLQQHARLE